jgi:hypothetical protein
MEALEVILGEMNTTLQLLDTNIERKKQRNAELKPMLDEAKKINVEIGKLKRERREVKSHLDYLIARFKDANGGAFPDGMYPLFREGNRQQSATGTDGCLHAEFIGYQQLSDGTYQAMFEVDGLDGYSSPTSLLAPTLRKKGIAIPDHPTFAQWKARQ